MRVLSVPALFLFIPSSASSLFILTISPDECQMKSFGKTLLSAVFKICKYDKGNGVAILNSCDYYRKLDNIIDDKTKFIEINHNLKDVHPCLQKESSISYYVRKYLKKKLKTAAH